MLWQRIIQSSVSYSWRIFLRQKFAQKGDARRCIIVYSAYTVYSMCIFESCISPTFWLLSFLVKLSPNRMNPAALDNLGCKHS